MDASNHRPDALQSKSTKLEGGRGAGESLPVVICQTWYHRASIIL